MSNKINFNSAHILYGDTLPEKHIFFNDDRNEISRLQLRQIYNTVSDYLAFKRFSLDYYAFVEQLKKDNESKEDGTDETEPAS